ncbi:MAG: cytochrome c [Kofleriaceae bacterium]
MRSATLAVVALACGAPVRAPLEATDRVVADATVAVLALDDSMLVFGATSVTILRAGTALATAAAPSGRWEAAAIIRTPAGERTAIGLANHSLWRVSLDGEFAPADDQLGVAGASVLALASCRETFVVGIAGGIVASRDALHAKRFVGPDATVVAAAHERVAFATPTAVEVYDLRTDTRLTYAIPRRATALGFLDATTDRPHLVVAAGDVLYVERDGELEPSGSAGTRVTVSGSRVWIAGSELGFVDGPNRVATRVALDRDARLFPASGNGVWIAATGHLVRYAPRSLDEQTWRAAVEPVFARSCSKCHRPGGVADVDLSTSAAWFERSEAIRRVLEAHTMPPEDGPALPDPERDALVRWLPR